MCSLEGVFEAAVDNLAYRGTQYIVRTTIRR
jgi:hypothetical protein